jgi:5-methyltetrahydrofolate--homocysteine methyltransferase
MNNELFYRYLEKKVLLFDGAFGTYAQQLGLSDGHFGERPGCMEYLSVSSPGLVEQVHSDYLRAGADAIETNTFGGNRLKLSEYGLQEDVRGLNRTSTELARRVADGFSGNGRRMVIGTMGPTGCLPSSTDRELSGANYSELKDVFREQAYGIIEGGADALLVETGQDILEMKAALNGARQALNEMDTELPIIAQCTLSDNGRMLMGQDIRAFCASMAYLDVDVLGINCGTGPEGMSDSVEFLSRYSPKPVSCVPNAGLPYEKEGRTVYSLSPSSMADIFGSFLDKWRLDIIGGCCGTTPAHIKALREVVDKCQKKSLPGALRFYSSFYTGFNMDEKARPLIVGERMNSQGSRKMKELLINEDFNSIIEIGKKQQSYGADILDVCVALNERDTETFDAVKLSTELAESVTTGLMVDSTDPGVIREVLEKYPGTAFINSVNLEDGGVKAEEVFRMAVEHGSFVVGLAIDEQGMAIHGDRKLAVASRLYQMAVGKYGIEPHRLIIDMLTFSLGTGEEEYADSALQTLNAIERLKERFPGVLTVLGASNVSFGLPKAARTVLNRVFVDAAVKKGLDLCIVDPRQYAGKLSLDPDEKQIAEDVIYNRSPKGLEKFIDLYSAARKNLPPKKNRGGRPEEEDPVSGIKKCIIERDKTSITGYVDKALLNMEARELINGVLMDTMDELGRKFDSGETVLPFILQSAEVMRIALDHLGDRIDKSDREKSGSIVLATVKGDVHDIGKNLVKMIFENNGFRVYDLGKQVSVDKIIDTVLERKAHLIGLSALLVSTSAEMGKCVRTLHDKGMQIPVLIGGAPVNKGFARRISMVDGEKRYSGGVFYARDAFSGLEIARNILDRVKRSDMMKEYFSAGPEEDSIATAKVTPRPPSSAKACPENPAVPPSPPFYGIHEMQKVHFEDVCSLIDKRALFSVGWKGGDTDKKSDVREEFENKFTSMVSYSASNALPDLKAVYGFFKCLLNGDTLRVYSEGGAYEDFSFGRTSSGQSIRAYFVEGKEDVVCLQAVTAGERMSGQIRKLGEERKITDAFYLHGFSVYLTEALADYVHRKAAAEWGLDPGASVRYSPGYPIWKDIRDQRKIFRLMEITERLGIILTDNYQMVPEQSTTAMIVRKDTDAAGKEEE